ncbi:MAG: membrane protein insertion efficiency factor YidD [Candidatus Pacebacteria bacterium]|jgi:putative component of membrane protein insertase Oxa1/YidC/SpoIIIJ protein YidD|nr:membrane protein insertion efficiency factor YidD [Candidatus Paceibacterota bacterium]
MKFYKLLSTIRHNIMYSVFGYSSVCFQEPSCGQYTVMEIKKNGTIIGLMKGVWRALHCHQ